MVLRHGDGDPLRVDAAGSERVRAEPFEAIALSVRQLVAGDEESEGGATG